MWWRKKEKRKIITKIVDTSFRYNAAHALHSDQLRIMGKAFTRIPQAGLPCLKLQGVHLELRKTDCLLQGFILNYMGLNMYFLDNLVDLGTTKMLQISLEAIDHY